VQRAYKTELDLNHQPISACKQHAGAARWAYNRGLQIKQERYKAARRSPTAIELHRELNALKKTEVPWMCQVSKCAPQEALWNLDAAFAHFFRWCAIQDHRHRRHPHSHRLLARTRQRIQILRQPDLLADPGHIPLMIQPLGRQPLHDAPPVQ
jgi:transposase